MLPGAKSTDNVHPNPLKMHIGGEFPSNPPASNLDLEKTFQACAAIIHEKRKLYFNEFPSQDLQLIVPILRGGLAAYQIFLEERLSNLAKDKQNSKAIMSALLLDMQRLKEFMVFLVPYGFLEGEMFIPTIETMQSILSFTIEEKIPVNKDELICILISFYDFMANTQKVTDHMRASLESLHYLFDMLSIKGSKAADETQLKLLSHQYRLELNEGNLKWASKTLELMQKIRNKYFRSKKKADSIHTDYSINCFLLSTKFADEKNFVQAFRWLQEYHEGQREDSAAVLPAEVAIFFQNPQAVSNQEITLKYRKEHVEASLALIGDKLRHRIFDMNEMDVLRLEVDFANPKEALAEIQRKLKNAKFNFGFDKKKEAGKYLCIHPLISCSLSKLQRLLNIIQRIKAEEKLRLESNKPTIDAIEPLPTLSNPQPPAALKVEPALPAAAETKVTDSETNNKKPSGKREKTSHPSKAPSAPTLEEKPLSDVERLRFDEALVGKTRSIYQCRLRGYGETPFFVTYLGEEKEASLEKATKSQIIESLFREPKIVPDKGETGFHRVNGVLVGKHKGFSVRLLPSHIQKGPKGILYCYGNYVDYHAGSDRKNLDERLKAIPRSNTKSHLP